jgi:saccharopine dehydrogenase (NAD+, L-lysine-forming)
VGAITGAAQMAGPAARSGLTQGVLKRLVSRLPGPSAKVRSEGHGQLWGQVTDRNGHRVQGTITTLNGYDLTADAVVRIAPLLAAGKVEPGAHTPSQAFGADFIRELDGAVVHDLG